MKKYIIIFAFILALLPLYACRNEQGNIYTLYESNSLKIENKGHITTIYDEKCNTHYIFEKHRSRKKKQAQAKEIIPSVDNDTLKIISVYGIIIVTDKANDKTIYIK